MKVRKLKSRYLTNRFLFGLKRQVANYILFEKEALKAYRAVMSEFAQGKGKFVDFEDFCEWSRLND